MNSSKSRRSDRRILFIGLSGYEYPHTRVRCYHFQRQLAQLTQTESTVVSYRDHLGSEFTEAEMYRMRDVDKLKLTWRGLKRLWPEKGNLFYIQKAHFHAASPYLLHRLGRNPYIFDYDDYDVELSNFFSRGSLNRMFFGSNRWDTITEQMASRAICCVAASHELIDYLKPLNPNVYYIPTGVDTHAFAPKDYSSPTQGPVVFFWNGLVWGEPILRSLHVLLEAFEEVYRQEPNVSLRIIGGGDAFGQFEDLIRERFSQLPIEISGWIKPTEMPAQLARVDVGCLPMDAPVATRWLRSKSPTKMFEYMAAALPVVSSAVGEPVYVIEDGKSGFLAADGRQMAQQMLQLARSAELRRQIGQAARQRIESNFSLEVLGQNLFDCLHEQGWVEQP